MSDLWIKAVIDRYGIDQQSISTIEFSQQECIFISHQMKASFDSEKFTEFTSMAFDSTQKHHFIFSVRASDRRRYSYFIVHEEHHFDVFIAIDDTIKFKVKLESNGRIRIPASQSILMQDDDTEKRLHADSISIMAAAMQCITDRQAEMN